MQYSSVFIKTRAIALSSISVLDLLWTVVLCIVLFSQWTVLDISERSLILVMLATHSATAVILLILLIVHFRPWLDAARILLLLTAQFGDDENARAWLYLTVTVSGTAGAFVYYYSGFECLNEATYQEGVCTFVIAFILIGSWIIPTLLVIYSFGLALMISRHRAMISKSLLAIDQESVLVTQEAGLAPKIPTHVAFVSRNPDLNHEADALGHSRSSRSTKVSSMVELHDKVQPNLEARLSKAPPVSRF